MPSKDRATPDRSSAQAKLIATSLLFQPDGFAGGAAMPVMIARVRSMFVIEREVMHAESARRSDSGRGYADRWLWALLPRIWAGWRTALVIVKPETVIAWHRRGFRLWWAWKSRRRLGRPSVPADVRSLIRTMAQANPRWGAPRIHSELLKLGINVSQATVAKYTGHRRQPPSQTWWTFLRNHVGQIVAADFFVVPTATYRLLFVTPSSPSRRSVVSIIATNGARPERGRAHRRPRHFRGHDHPPVI